MKQLLRYKENEPNYEHCCKKILKALTDLDDVDMSVGNLRVTKIGRLLTKYMKNLPGDLSVVAAKIKL